MGIYDQASILLDAAEFVGKERALAVYAYAEAQGLDVMKYDPVTDTWYFSDGEPYRTELLVGFGLIELAKKEPRT
jgi:hypothetical protein